MHTETVEGFRLSAQQRRVWLAQAGSSALRAACALRLSGIEGDAIERALRQVAQVHEILRTRFHCLTGMDIPVQVLDEEAAVDLERIAPPAAETAGEAAWERRGEELWQSLLAAPVEPERGPLWRAALLSRGDGSHLLVLALPALLADTRGLRNLCAELWRVLAEPAGEEHEVAQYADYSDWQNELASAEEGEEGRAYWRRQQQAAAPIPVLPGEAAPGRLAGFSPAAVPCPVAGDLLQGLDRLDREAAARPSTALLACFGALLARLTGQARLSISRLFDGRSVEQLEGALGSFARFLPVAVRADETFRFADLHKALADTVAEHEAWQDLVPEAPAAADPAVQLEDVDWPRWERQPRGGAELARLWACVDRFKLKLSRLDGASGPALLLHYDPAFYRESDVVRLAGQLAALIAGVAGVAGAAGDPRALLGDLPLLSPA
ncbi:MAG TPA: condensation domain-containing protein, partial [Thermoanaerobaculia bacterium]|nr:condensation domain-containing protein [Thermoanaerobaculia bacterium]